MGIGSADARASDRWFRSLCEARPAAAAQPKLRALRGQGVVRVEGTRRGRREARVPVGRGATAFDAHPGLDARPAIRRRASLAASLP
jgi:hypothetical protein